MFLNLLNFEFLWKEARIRPIKFNFGVDLTESVVFYFKNFWWILLAIRFFVDQLTFSRASNNSKCLIIVKNEVKETYWRDLKAGDIVLIPKDGRIPADLIILNSSNPDGAAFMETSTLDGEKHLKPRYSLEETLNLVQAEIQGFEPEFKGKIKANIEARISVEQPNPSLYKFEGFMNVLGEKKSIGVKNFLFKGARIRNVKWVIGVTVYTGTDTKIQQNGAEARFKISNLEQRLHNMIVLLLIFQIFLSISAVILKIIWDDGFGWGFEDYINANGGGESGLMILVFFRYFIFLGNIIPISLIVALESVRLIQAYFLISNYDLKNKEIDR